MTTEIVKHIMVLTNEIKIINGDDYEFWKEFNLKYPQSDDSNFRINNYIWFNIFLIFDIRI